MTDPNKLLDQIQELDSHITRLLEAAKGLQDKIRGATKECDGCYGTGEMIVSMAGGLSSFVTKCDVCNGTGKTHA